jgi:uncharacterized protein DUF1996
MIPLAETPRRAYFLPGSAAYHASRHGRIDMVDLLRGGVLALIVLPFVMATAHAQGVILPRGEATGSNFGVACPFSHTLPDDPIVYPRKPGASHQHDFFGNRSTNAFSTARTLTKDTTCTLPEDASSYWTPAVYLGGERVTARRMTAYYYPSVDDLQTIVPIPRGLKMVTTGTYSWVCTGPGWYVRLDDPRTPPTCPDGMHVVLRVRFPSCWNGHDLDSADHRSHMAFPKQGTCPATHPVPFPTLVMAVHYRTEGGALVTAPPEHPSVPHADFFSFWDQWMQQWLIDHCLKTGRRCGNAAYLGSGVVDDD